MRVTQFKRAIMIVVLVFLPPILAAALLGGGMQIPFVAVIVAFVVGMLILSIFRPGSGFVDADPDDLPVYDGPLQLDGLGRVELLLGDARVWILRDRGGASYRLDMDSDRGSELRDLLQSGTDADLAVLDAATDGSSIVTIWRSPDPAR